MAAGSLVKRIERTNYLITGLAGVLGALFLPADRALGLLVGALIGSVNFSLTTSITGKWIGSLARGDSGKRGFFLIPKMAGLVVVIAAAIYFLPIDPIFLAIGFSVFFVSICIESARQVSDGPDETEASTDQNHG
ncbi:MAG TPA: ATP synthase subunit I [Kofleriaceae bacterium]|jgi:hypothetical protein|nr:ATP synthase subunit I [Kofleriaceae bacterium]